MIAESTLELQELQGQAGNELHERLVRAQAEQVFRGARRLSTQEESRCRGGPSEFKGVCRVGRSHSVLLCEAGVQLTGPATVSAVHAAT